LKSQTFARLFDHSIVRPDAAREEVIRAAETAAGLSTATLTVQPHDIRLAVEVMRGSGVLVGTVAGSPHDSHQGEWLGIEPTGKPLAFTGANVDRGVNWWIVEHGGAANMLGPLLEIGAIKVIGPTAGYGRL
jgi:hypothetical protein